MFYEVAKWYTLVVVAIDLIVGLLSVKEDKDDLAYKLSLLVVYFPVMYFLIKSAFVA